MEKVKIHARVLQSNIVGQTAFFKVLIRGLEFEDYKIPQDYPVQTMDVDDEFTVHFGAPGEMTEAEIAVIIPDRCIVIDASLDNNNFVVNHIKTLRLMDMSFGEHLGYLKALHKRD